MAHILIIQATFYDDICQMLHNQAQALLTSEGHQVTTIDVPGCFEIPAAISMAQNSGKYDGYVALGCVIRGETSHYDYVCQESAHGINMMATMRQLAVGFGIITAENRDQAYARADKDGHNVGRRAADACLTMLNIKQDHIA